MTGGHRDLPRRQAQGQPPGPGGPGDSDSPGLRVTGTSHDMQSLGQRPTGVPGGQPPAARSAAGHWQSQWVPVRTLTRHGDRAPGPGPPGPAGPAAMASLTTVTVTGKPGPGPGRPPAGAAHLQCQAARSAPGTSLSLGSPPAGFGLECTSPDPAGFGLECTSPGLSLRA